MRFGITGTLSVVSLLSVFSTSALALDWQIKDLGSLGGNEQLSQNLEHMAFGINNQGQVVGWSMGPPRQFDDETVFNFMEPFVTGPNGGPMTNLATPEMEFGSRGVAIHEAGQVVIQTSSWRGIGAALISNPPYTQPQLVDPGLFTRAHDIDESGRVVGGTLNPNAFITNPDNTAHTIVKEPGIATGINENGQVALHGWELGEDKMTAYIWTEAGGLQPLATRAEYHAHTVGINESGQILGFESESSFGNPFRNMAFLTGPDGQDVMYLDTFGGSFNQALDLNNLGQVVGQAQDEFGIFHPYYTGPNGQGLINLSLEADVLNAGWTNIRVAAINDLGQIAGTGDHNGIRRPFLLTPVPEPETYAMMLAGLSMLGFLRRRKTLQV